MIRSIAVPMATLRAPACMVRAEAEVAGWKPYTNVRLGFRLVHPPELVASRPPEIGAGSECHTRDPECMPFLEGDNDRIAA